MASEGQWINLRKVPHSEFREKLLTEKDIKRLKRMQSFEIVLSTGCMYFRQVRMSRMAEGLISFHLVAPHPAKAQSAQ
jgi:hypothetical protein